MSDLHCPFVACASSNSVHQSSFGFECESFSCAEGHTFGLWRDETLTDKCGRPLRTDVQRMKYVCQNGHKLQATVESYVSVNQRGLQIENQLGHDVRVYCENDCGHYDTQGARELARRLDAATWGFAEQERQ